MKTRPQRTQVLTIDMSELLKAPTWSDLIIVVNPVWFLAYRLFSSLKPKDVLEADEAENICKIIREAHQQDVAELHIKTDKEAIVGLDAELSKLSKELPDVSIGYKLTSNCELIVKYKNA
jgi:hypothetical protein